MLATLGDAATTVGKWVMLYPISKTYKDILNVAYFHRKVPRSVLRAGITISATVVGGTLMALNAPESVLGLEFSPELLASVTALGSAAVASFLVKHFYRLGVYTWSGKGIPEQYIPVVDPESGEPIHITNTEYIINADTADKILPTLRENIKKLIPPCEHTPTDDEAKTVFHKVLSQLIYDIHFPLEEDLKHKAKSAFQGLLNGSFLQYASYRTAKVNTLKEVQEAIENLAQDSGVLDIEKAAEMTVPVWLTSDASQSHTKTSLMARTLRDYKKAGNKNAWIESKQEELRATQEFHVDHLSVISTARERAFHHQPRSRRLSTSDIV